ncbi:MAG: DUF6458 family protein [Acidimicrobiales bacterium]
MGLGTSIFLVAVGAILDFAITTTNTHGIDINTIGLILMIVGAFGIVLSLFFWNSWGGFGGGTGRGNTVVRDPDYVVRDSRPVVERDPYRTR